MAFKFVALFALVAAANAGIIAQPAYQHGYAAPLAYAAPVHHVAKVIAPVAAYAKVAVDADYDPHPHYDFAYEVQDHVTGDQKSQHESRDGDVVHGSYSLVDADGYQRTVEYTADDHNGFNAVVHREPLGHHVAKVVAPVAYAAPVHHVAKVIAPVAYAAPIHHVAKVVAPVAYSAPHHYAAAPSYYH